MWGFGMKEGSIYDGWPVEWTADSCDNVDYARNGLSSKVGRSDIGRVI